MKKLLLPLLSLIFLTSCDVVDDIASNVLGESLDIEEGLKLALTTGFEEASDSASGEGVYWSDSANITPRTTPIGENTLNWVRDQAIQIVLPEEAQKVYSHLDAYKEWRSNEVVALVLDAWGNPLEEKVNSLANSKEEIWKSLNSAAETAAPESKTVFVEAITNMSLSDAKGILFPNNGDTEEALLKDSTAATTYLYETTHTGLTAIYSPIVGDALNQVEATTLWNNFADGYTGYKTSYTDLHTKVTNLDLIGLLTLLPNSDTRMTRASLADLALIKEGLADPSTLPDLDVDLAEYTTGKALDGLYHLVGGEEVKIRRDPLLYVSKFAAGTKQLIVDVFTSEDTE